MHALRNLLRMAFSALLHAFHSLGHLPVDVCCKLSLSFPVLAAAEAVLQDASLDTCCKTQYIGTLLKSLEGQLPHT